MAKYGSNLEWVPRDYRGPHGVGLIFYFLFWINNDFIRNMKKKKIEYNKAPDRTDLNTFT